MQSDTGPGRVFDRTLDALASRVGVSCLVGLLLTVSLGVGLFVNSVVIQLESNHDAFRDRQARNGYVALSDLQRITLVAQRAVDIGEMTPELDRDFRDAVDFLFVRVNNFERTLEERSSSDSAVASVAALRRVIDLCDAAISQGYPDNHALVDGLLTETGEARRHLVQFLDDMRRAADLLLEAQSRAVLKQQWVVIGILAGLAIFGAVAVLLLQREVLGRRARQRAEQDVEFLAFYDQLTELPNRVQFQSRMQEMLEGEDPFALLYVDLDDFKVINDTHGHATGDAVLRHVADILQTEVRALDGFAARLGGDEFALLLPTDDIICLTGLCERMLAATVDPLPIEGEAVSIGLSIGLATSTQVSSQMEASAEVLSRVTDFSLYASKSDGRRRYTIYDQGLEAKFLERRAMLEELPEAIENGQLQVYLQPKVEISGGRVFGFEALVRWQRKGRVVPPGDFIVIAEESGLVVDIDRFMLEKSTSLVAEWNATQGTEFSVSVNLSALHFNSRRIIESVQDALWASNLPARLLTLEITETTEMRDWRRAREILEGLHAVGARIAIDDFGIGYSSLAYLRSIPADELKIDRSLVMELDASEKARLLLSSVLALARNLEMEVIVEGIETEAQVKIVRAMGAPLAQGYYYGRPQPWDQALARATMDRHGQLVAMQS